MTISFIHTKTESGDDYYFVIPRLVDASNIGDVLAERMGDEAEYAWAHHIETLETADGETVEWCVMHPDFPDVPHRGNMTEDAARKWVADVEEMGAVPGSFYVASRTVGPWVDET